MERLKLRVYDGVAVLGFLMLPPLLTTGLSELVRQNHAAVWLTVLLASALMLALFLITAHLLRRHGGSGLVEVTSAVMGRPVGILYGAVLGAYFCFVTGIHIRESAEVLKGYGLPLTPMVVVAGLILLAAVALNAFGGQAIAKSAGIFLIVLLGGIASILLLGLNRYCPENLAPALGYGLPAVLRESVGTASLFESVTVLFLLAPAFSRPSELKKAGVTALGLSAAIYLLVGVCFVMLFPPAMGSRMMSGMMEMGRSIYYNHFFYRFESIVLLLLIFTSALQAAVGLFVARVSLAGMAGSARPSGKTMTALCAIPVAVAVFLPAHLLALTRLYLPAIRQCGVFFMAGFPLLVGIISSIKGASSHEKN